MQPKEIYKRGGFTFYRCPRCNTIFSNMIVFTEWDFYDAVPRYCPCCRAQFTNGGDSLPNQIGKVCV